MEFFDKLKNGGNFFLAPDEGAKTAASPDYNPKEKNLEWFSSEEGLESFKRHMTVQNYLLEDVCVAEFEKKYEGKRYDGYSFQIFMDVYHKGANLPCVYFEALAAALNVQPLNIIGLLEYFVLAMKIVGRPFAFNEDGDPELCSPILEAEQLLSVEKNPLLNFVKNFNVFTIRDDALGSVNDKYDVYINVIKFIGNNIQHISIEENQWLFDKNTYLNDFGTVRKLKGFLKKCKEVSGFPEYFEEEISKLQ